MKKITSLIITLMLFSTLLSTNILADSDISVKINDESVIFDQPPIMQNDRILVPIRALAEKMKFNVQWNEDNQLITISDMSKTLKLQIGNDIVNKAYKYNTAEENVKIDVPATIYNDYTYVPLRAVTELFGADVTWHQEVQMAEIKYLNTYGKIITFEDEGMEKLCRLEVMIDYRHDTTNGSNDDFNGLVDTEFLRNEGEEAQRDWKELLRNDPDKWDKKWWNIYEKYFDSIWYDGNIAIYDGPFYEGMALQITQLGFNNNIIPSWIDIHSLNDMKYLPNVNIVNLQGCKNLSDISGLKYNKLYKCIDLLDCSVYDFGVLNDIMVEEFIQLGQGFNSLSSYHGDDNNHNLQYTLNENRYREYAKSVSELYDIIRNVYNEIISVNMSDYEKAKAIHDWIIDNTEYDYDTYEQHYSENKTNNYSRQSYEITGIFLNGKAVCQGYSETYEFLCNMAGLDCMTVNGEADGSGGWGGHAWNIVKVDNNYYHVDTTFDDGGSSDTYFLKSDEFMKQDHSWGTDLIGLHSCPKSYNE